MKVKFGGAGSFVETAGDARLFVGVDADTTAAVAWGLSPLRLPSAASEHGGGVGGL